jgi:dihydropteroate synthase
MQAYTWRLPDRELRLSSKPMIMGIVNVTPDSFSDGGRYATTEAALAHGMKLVEEGADLLDIGGESSRPGAEPVPVEEEVRRVIPVVCGLAARTSIPLSVDTYKAKVAEEAVLSGASIINDITALKGDPAMPHVVQRTKAGAVLMHMQGTPATMQINPSYANVVAEIGSFFEERLRSCADVGIAAEHLVLDPGIGFGKSGAHNLEILAHLETFQRFRRPLVLGVSLKGFLGKMLGRSVELRVASSVAVVCHAMMRQAVQVVRVHNVAETRDAMTVIETLSRAGSVTA